MPTINNYTFSEPVFTIPEQSNIVSQVGATAVITITPNTGFTATAADFSATSFNTTYISGVAFTQSGNNVLCTITLINTATMPSNNVILGLCVSGSAEQQLITIGGKYSATVGSNVTGGTSETDIPYSKSNTRSEVSHIVTRTYNAASGYFWSGSSIPSINIVTGNQKYYLVDQTPTFDSSNRLTNITYDVSYQFPNKSVSGDVISISVPSTQEIYVPVAEISGYKFNTAGLGNLAQTRDLTVFGGEGAAVTVVLNDGTAGTVIINNETIPATGQITKPVEFPELIKGNAAVDYSLTFSGDLPTGGLIQLNPALIKQRDEITIRFLATTANPISGFTQINKQLPALLTTPFTNPGNYNKNKPFSSENLQYPSGVWYCKINDTITASSGTIAIAKEFIEISDFLNAGTVTQEVTGPQSAVTSLQMQSTTGITAGMKFNNTPIDANVSNNNGNLAPFSFSVSSVTSGTELAITPAITVRADEILGFNLNNGNFFDILTSKITVVNSTNIKIEADIAIFRSGDDGVDFTLNLDNLITHTP